MTSLMLDLDELHKLDFFSPCSTMRPNFPYPPSSQSAQLPYQPTLSPAVLQHPALTQGLLHTPSPSTHAHVSLPMTDSSLALPTHSLHGHQPSLPFPHNSLYYTPIDSNVQHDFGALEAIFNPPSEAPPAPAPVPQPPAPADILAQSEYPHGFNNATRRFIDQYHSEGAIDFNTPAGAIDFNTPAGAPPAPLFDPGSSVGGAASSTSGSSSRRRRKSPERRAELDQKKLEDRRKKNRISSAKCYYNRKRQIEEVERTLTEEKRRAIALYQLELDLRNENARLKRELVHKNIRIPATFLTSTRTEPFVRPPVAHP